MNDVTIRHIGLEIDFHHPESDKLRLSHQIEDDYSIDKERAAIFTETATVQVLNCEDMLDWYLMQSQTTLADHLPARTYGESEPRRRAVTFPLHFPEGTFHMMTDRGAVDIKTLRLAIEVTL
jgi:hypothetical protein